ncbi:tRNA uracil 4-sulfurtransferase ThiI [Halomonas sp. 328]|uniref:tRNA uracil 4-sulfurtransferase ThiI n=1 Tax=Halomonas sp. 328 TaxID=2776704 RepID=UPI0018A74685|nr:tRNA uracil 4-sulfurtransferase ThiI [Halomonas sp. 328]MBF8224270.1 tRNA 4-thiouridine(8) synthase ThiI [Halomonas sp. 328]
MNYLIKLFPEITIKSKSARKNLIKCLRRNLRKVVDEHDPEARLSASWDAIEIALNRPLATEALAEFEAALGRVPGIHEVLAVENSPLGDFDAIAERVLPLWLPRIAGKSFRVRVKRKGRHDFTSADLERYLGGKLLAGAEGARVDLSRPEETLALEVNRERLQLIGRRWPGLGGYPLGTQESALVLMSGGYDSPVAAYRMMRRGVKSHFLFFNLGGPAHEQGVRAISHYLWQRYSPTHKVNFISVPFEGVVKEILTTIPDHLMGVVLKRMMLRVAERVAARARIPALVTGEAIAQVSSQSLHNLAMIDAVTERLVLRPVVADDKQTIIDEARHIGTAAFSESMPEYCGVISNRPSLKVKRGELEEAEAGFDFTVLETALEMATRTRSDRLIADQASLPEITTLDGEAALATAPRVSVIDIRHPDEREAAPLSLPDTELLAIPFFELQERAPALPRDRHYLLYCDQGVMSRMQALHLADQGLAHFGVYRR